MGFCTAAVGFIPSYQSIGVISVCLLLFSRLIQVLAIGGEYISSIAFLIESCEFIITNARKEKRTLFDISKEAVNTIKNQMTESLLIFTLVWFGVSVTMLIFIYGPIHMVTMNHLFDYQAFLINSISLLFVITMIPVFGRLSDKYGRSSMIFLSIIALLVLIIPYYFYISTGQFYDILLCHLLISIPCASLFSMTPVFITEIIPLSIRCSSVGLIYSLATCLGGGITPLIALFFSHHVHASYSPGFVLFLPGALSLLALCYHKISVKIAEIS